MSKEHNDFIVNLNELKDSDGWKILLKVLDDNIKDVEEDLFDPELELDDPILESKRTLKLKIMRNERKILKNLPDSLIQTYTDPKSYQKDFDPYEK